MTREEIEKITMKTLEYLGGYAFTDDNRNVHLPTLMHDFLNDSRVYFDEFINVSLPSDLDEAAGNYAIEVVPDNFIPDEGNGYKAAYTLPDIKAAFKAGAEWMAKQGETH